jgi:hypothetical protein
MKAHTHMTDIPLHPFTRTGLRAIGWLHFFMGLLSLAATACAIIFGFLPERTAAALLASLAGIALTPLYFAVAYELSNHRPWTRFAGIILGFIGAGLALLILLVGLAPILHALTWSTLSAPLLIATFIAFGLISICDLTAILFLQSPRTKAVFIGESYSPIWPDPLSPLELLIARSFRLRF